MTRIWKTLTALFLTALLALTAACGSDGDTPADQPGEGGVEQQTQDGAPAGGVVEGVNADNYPRIDGSTANMPLLARLYSEICGVPRADAETMVDVSGGTGAVWRNLQYEGADLLLVYEAPSNIRAEMEEDGLWENLEISPIGRDGLVFLVNAGNPVDSLTREQLVGIYTGEITDWSQVGGAPGPIAAFQRNEESGSQTLFMALLMGDTQPMDPPSELRMVGMGALIDAVSEYDGSGGAIGFSVYYYAELMYQNPDLKLLRVDGVEPTTSTIGDGTYPLVNDFYAVIRADTPADSPARLLRDWLLTDAGARLLESENYVPVF